MKSRKIRLKESRLYLIIDKRVLGSRPIPAFIKKITHPKPLLVQYRDKISNRRAILNNAFLIKKILGDKALFILNDHLDIAKIIDCDGLHIGQDDLPVKFSRRLLGRKKIIGVSCHSLKQALLAQEEGADYISIGPIFATPTKPEYRPVGLKLLDEVSRKIKIPYFAIGSIDEKNARELLLHKTNRIAMCRSICRSENIASTIDTYIKLLN